MEAATVKTLKLTRIMSGRQQRQQRQMLEPVQELYSTGSSVLSERHDLPYNTATSVICNKPDSKSPKRSTALINPMNLLGKLRDRYVKLMNEVAMGGDFTCVASYGCQIAPDYPGTLESRASKDQREMEVWRQEVVVVQRESRESERREPIGAQ